MSEAWRGGGEEAGQHHKKTLLLSLVSIAQYHQITFPNDKLNYKLDFFYEAETDNVTTTLSSATPVSSFQHVFPN